MGNIGYIFGYVVIFAFCLGVIVGMVAQKIGDRNMAMFRATSGRAGGGGGIIQDTTLSVNTSSYTDTGISTTDNVNKYVLCEVGPTQNSGEPVGFLRVENNTVYDKKPDGGGWDVSVMYQRYTVLSNGNIGIQSTFASFTSVRIIAIAF